MCVHLHDEFEDEVWYHHVLIKCPGFLLDCGDCMLALDVPFVPLSCWHQLHRLSCSTSVSYQDLLPALCFLTVSRAAARSVCAGTLVGSSSRSHQHLSLLQHSLIVCPAFGPFWCLTSSYCHSFPILTNLPISITTTIFFCL